MERLPCFQNSLCFLIQLVVKNADFILVAFVLILYYLFCVWLSQRVLQRLIPLLLVFSFAYHSPPPFLAIHGKAKRQVLSKHLIN